MLTVYDYLKSHTKEIIASLEELVVSESPSNDKRLVNQCGETLKKIFYQQLGVEPEVIPQRSVGDHLKFTYGSGEDQVLVVGHFDTVWAPGQLQYRVEGDRIYGPGVLDMKAGLIQAIWAVKALKEAGVQLNKKLVFFCNADEEIGSVTSRPLIEEEAKKSKAVLVVEPAEAATGALKTARKGVSMYELKITGKSAHAGNHHEDGASAIRELARQIEFLENLTDYKLGTTVNVGVVQGGSRSNVVPSEAQAQIDVRTTTMSEALRISEIMNRLTPSVEGTSVSVSGGINRPPMERGNATARLYEVAKTAASQLGFDIQEAMVGGGSDGNFTAALGVPTLDGLGAVGEGPHAVYEHIQIPTIAQRAALLSKIIELV